MKLKGIDVMDTLAPTFGIFEPDLISMLNIMRSFVMNIRIIGIDLAKSIFQILVLLNDNSVHSHYKASRAKLLNLMDCNCCCSTVFPPRI